MQPSSTTVKRTQKTLADRYYKDAVQFEQKKEWVKAKKNYQLALTADPENQLVQQRLKQLNGSIADLAQNYYETSKRLKKQGKYEKAATYLRLTLHLAPNHKNARKDLISDQQINVRHFIWHTIKKGESLSVISKEYYGTFNLASTIAKVNQIKDAAKIRLGMKLKIPQLEAYPFINQKKEPVTLSVEIEPIEESFEPEVDPVVMYKSQGIEFFESKQYQDAIAEFKKILNTRPDEPQATDYIVKAYKLLGSQALSNQQYLKAAANYKNALNYDKKCLRCKEQVTKSENAYKEFHYKAGMKFFDEQNLSVAISEWDLVYKVDPKYKRVSELLEKARTIQKNVNKLKRNQ